MSCNKTVGLRAITTLDLRNQFDPNELPESVCTAGGCGCGIRKIAASASADAIVCSRCVSASGRYNTGISLIVVLVRRRQRDEYAALLAEDFRINLQFDRLQPFGGDRQGDEEQRKSKSS